MHHFRILLIVWLAIVEAIQDINRADEDVMFRKAHSIRSTKHTPSFYIIGAPKCATTSLYELFVTHPNICRSYTKEVHYFDHADKWEKGAAFYTSHFNNEDCAEKLRSAGEEIHYMDSTPDYFANREVPIRMLKSFTEADRAQKKFILVLREPVEREYSWFNHRARFCSKQMHTYMVNHRAQAQKVAAGTAVWNLKGLCSDVHCRSSCSNRTTTARPGHEIEALANFTEYMQNGDLIPEKSAYVQHLRHWLHYFERRQFFVVNLATLLTNTTDTVQRMVRFLGLPPLPQRTYDSDGRLKLPHSNSAKVATTFDCAVRTALYPYYAPLNRELYALLRQSYNTSSNSNSNNAAAATVKRSSSSSKRGKGSNSKSKAKRTSTATTTTSTNRVLSTSSTISVNREEEEDEEVQGVQGDGPHEPYFPDFVTRPCAPGQLF